MAHIFRIIFFTWVSSFFFWTYCKLKPNFNSHEEILVSCLLNFNSSNSLFHSYTLILALCLQRQVDFHCQSLICMEIIKNNNPPFLGEERNVKKWSENIKSGSCKMEHGGHNTHHRGCGYTAPQGWKTCLIPCLFGNCAICTVLQNDSQFQRNHYEEKQCQPLGFWEGIARKEMRKKGKARNI